MGRRSALPSDRIDHIVGGDFIQSRKDFVRANRAVFNTLLHSAQEAVIAAESEIRSEENAEQLAAYIMRDLTSNRNCKYNDYSGNLRRSYFVAFNGRNARHLYAAKMDSALMPEAGKRGGSTPDSTWNIYRKTDSGHYTEEVIETHKRRGFVGTYKLKKKRHPVKGQETRNWKLVESVHRDKKRRKRFFKRVAPNLGEYYRYVSTHSEVEDPWSLEPKRYIERAMKVNKMFASNNKRDTVHFVVGNYTPYRRFVEARGYRVIGGGMRPRWERKAMEIYHYRINIAFKQLAYRFNKGGKALINPNGQYDRPIRSGHYARAAENAGYGGAYGHALLIGKGLISGKNIYGNWQFDRLY